MSVSSDDASMSVRVGKKVRVDRMAAAAMSRMTDHVTGPRRTEG